jgi:hypothetical protein
MRHGDVWREFWFSSPRLRVALSPRRLFILLPSSFTERYAENKKICER